MMMTMIKLLAFILVTAAVTTTPVTASASVVTASSCSVADVNAAIAKAVEGDTVKVPACPSATDVWGTDSNTSVQVNKNITLQGSGVATTVLLGATTAFTIDAR
jgi:hypothetical protein